jgi:DNA-directed RNA polymerase specialized sigma subunit
MQLYIQGEVIANDIQIHKQKWSESKTTKTLSEFLGMTEKEYLFWKSNPSNIHKIIIHRLNKTPLHTF